MTSIDEDSLDAAEARLRTLISEHSPTPEKLERYRQGAQRLKEMLSSVPFHQQGAALDPEGEEAYWLRLHASCINL